MADYLALVSCQLIWDVEDEIRSYLERYSISIDMPRFEGQQLEEDDLLPIIHRYDGMIAGDDRITKDVLQAATRLKVVSKWGVGIDSIDTVEAQRRGITVMNTPGVFGEELADYAMGFILMLARQQHEVNTRVKNGTWYKVRGISLAAKTLGIVGLGSSGRALARRGVAASMRVLGTDVLTVADIQDCQVVPLQYLLREADIISLHIPVTDQSRHLIDASAISMLKPGTWIVNTSRGALIDESALVGGLESGQVGAAALDVFEIEPIESDNALLNFDNVIVGSHNGSNTSQAVARTTDQAVENLVRGLGITP